MRFLITKLIIISAKVRFILALWFSKTARILMRMLGQNATFLPGVIALKLCPNFIKYIGKPKTLISITGTNGKTTTINLICDALEAMGERIISNRFGTNVEAGIAVTLMNGSTIFGQCKYDIGVFETDERSVKRIYPVKPPTHIVITNLFRDSIARNAHPAYIADFLTDAIPSQSHLILNADDPISSRVAPDNTRVYFGIKELPTDIKECINLINDLRICPMCSGKLEYEYRRYHHIGKYKCMDCEFNAPDYDYIADDVDFNTMTMRVSDKDGHGNYNLMSDSIFNVYNMLTAISLLRELGKTHYKISNTMASLNILSSRYNEQKAGNVKIIMQMAKQRNALAVSRAFDYISSKPGDKQILLMMNCQTDGKNWSENPCWMYDCDFEFLNKPDITKIITTGYRYKDLYLRSLFAGIPKDKLFRVRDELDAVKLFDYSKESNIYILYGTDSFNLAKKVQAKIIDFADVYANKHYVYANSEVNV